MFKKGDVVVRTHSFTSNSSEEQHLAGYIFKCVSVFNGGYVGRAYYDIDKSIHPKRCRKATDKEIKWFEAGITNINQIPEVGGTFDFEDETDCSQNTIDETITSITDKTISCNNDEYYWSDYIDWYQQGYIKNYKSPLKLENLCAEIELPRMSEEPFKIEDLKHCKINDLKPEDHEIIQPWLFSLGYKWHNGKNITAIHKPYLYLIRGDFIYTGTCPKLFNQRGKGKQIKKELILNYIKQLNINNNDIFRENQEISGRHINGEARMASGRQQGATRSRLKGNVQSSHIRKTQIRSIKVTGEVKFF